MLTRDDASCISLWLSSSLRRCRSLLSSACVRVCRGRASGCVSVLVLPRSAASLAATCGHRCWLQPHQRCSTGGPAPGWPTGVRRHTRGRVAIPEFPPVEALPSSEWAPGGKTHFVQRALTPERASLGRVPPHCRVPPFMRRCCDRGARQISQPHSLLVGFRPRRSRSELPRSPRDAFGASFARPAHICASAHGHGNTRLP